MLIETHQIESLQSRIKYNFSNTLVLVYTFTDYFHHYYYEKKRKSLFQGYESRQRPQILSTQENQERLRNYRQDLEGYIRAALMEGEHNPTEINRYLSYILNDRQLLLKLSHSFCLTREQDVELAKIQTLFIIKAVYQDCSEKGDIAAFQSWFSERLKPFLEEVKFMNGCSTHKLVQESKQLKILLSQQQHQLAHQEHHILSQDDYIASREQYISQLEEEVDQSALLQEQLQRLEGECAMLRRQLAMAQNARPTPVASSTTSRVVTHSSAIRIDRVQHPTFEQEVLDLPHRGLGTAATLEPLRGCISGEEDPAFYFEQYPPYILEEVRAGIDAQMKTISHKNLLPFIITLNLDRLPEQPEALVRLSCWVSSKALPDLDHGFYKEAVLVLTEASLPKTKYKDRQAPQGVASQLLSGLLAIASTKSAYESRGDTENSIVEIELILPKSDYEAHIESWKKSEGQLRLHWLYGLIPSSRTYEVCLSPPVVTFQEQFIRAKLLEWPDVKPTPNPDSGVLKKLNKPQRIVVDKLIQAQSGLFFLQGPPGTGKTTTAVSLLAQLRISYPEQRILICAPANQAVRVILINALKLMPSEVMALTGVAKNIPEGLEDVFVHKYAYHLYQPLILLKKQLLLKRSLEFAHQIDLQYQHVFAKLNQLLTGETPMPVKEEVKSKVQKLLEELGQNHEEFKQSLSTLGEQKDPEKFLEVQDLIEKTEESILRLQRASHFLESFLIQRAPMVFSTLISSGRDWLRKQVSKFSIVILDEAAQALVPEAILPLRFNPNLYIHIGDPNQLPATIISKAGQEGGFSHSMMHWLVKEFKQPYEMLTIQYRMLEQICQWPSKQYYENRLTTALEIRQRPFAILRNQHLHPAFQVPCLFFNIQSGREDRRGPEASASISNLQEAKAIAAMVSYLILTCGIEAKKIGVITFYSAQVGLLHKEIARLPFDKRRELTVSTVDGFQGEEKDITLISVVRTSKSVGFLNDQRRLNVAMTRAKEARWVFGFFAPLSKSNSDLPSLLGDQAQAGRIIEEEQLMKHVRVGEPIRR